METLIEYSRTKSGETDRTNFLVGSHLKADYGMYQHHGIYCGDGTVIHFGRGIFDRENAIVERVDLETFSNGRQIEVVDSPSSFDSRTVVERAFSRLGEKGYDLWDNNCEHFVRWCRSGENESQQIDVAETVMRQAAAAASKPFIKSVATKLAVKRLGAAAATVAKGPTIVAGVADVAQATAEIVAAKNGMTKEESRKVGQKTGIASSIALGWMVGGPVTAAAGVGIWFVGQRIADQAVESGKQIVNSAIDSTNRNGADSEAFESKAKETKSNESDS